MRQRTIRSIFALLTLASVSVAIAFAQSPASSGVPAADSGHTWQDAQFAVPSRHKLLVITVDQPQRRHSCHVQSITPEKLVCSRAFGGPHTYLRRQIVALILPGDLAVELELVAGFNGALGASIWGTVVLAATCPACAAGTAIAAVLFFCAAAAVLIGDEQPDRLLYLAPGWQLAGKLHFVQP